MRAKITKRTVDAARPGRRDTFLWDTAIPGFGLKVTSAGRKVYVLQYRMGGRGTPVQRYTIGSHGAPWTPDKAREEAQRLLGQIDARTDPARVRALARDEPTIAELCDRYLSDGPAIKPNKKASSWAIDRSNIGRHIKPLLGRKKVGTVARADVERFQQDVAAGKTKTDEKTGPHGRAIVEGGKGTAARSVAVLGAIMSYAVRRGYRADNPVKGIERLKGERRERYLSLSEFSRLGGVLAAAERDGANPAAIAAIRLLLLTGARKSEILGLKWEWVDFERGCLRLPDSKTGAKAIPLGAPALELLASLARIEGSPFVFPAEKGNGHLIGVPKVWQRIRALAGLGDVRLHDLRHSFASFAVASGNSLYLVGKVLGHRQARTTEVYAHVHDDPLRAVADRTAAGIASALKGGAAGARVVELPKRTA